MTKHVTRPIVHFTPPRGWMNDPNGLVWYAGEYHLFYQHNPYDLRWGPMHWGHAVSTDLVCWDHLPIALYPDERGAIFSGSAVVDTHNTAGFGAHALIAVFTLDHPEGQSQGLAFSTDRGRTWEKYAGNPVLLPPPGYKDFRDPKVFWYGTEERGHWVMVLSGGKEILFYTSPDLKQWQPSGRLAIPRPAAAVWETPDLMPLPVADSEDTRWVLTAGVTRGAVAGGSGQAYVIGTFDGLTFRPDDARPMWADYGPDFYAGQSWNNTPQDRRVWIGWMNNWTYAERVPATVWRGTMSIPRALWLERTPRGLRLAQAPVAEIAQHHGTTHRVEDTVLKPGQVLFLGEAPASDTRVVLDRAGKELGRVGLRVRGRAGEEAVLAVDLGKATIMLCRRSADATFAGCYAATLPLTVPPLDVRLVVDTTSVEVFAAHGTVCFTAQIFPHDPTLAVEIFGEGFPVRVVQAVFSSLTASRENSS